MSSRPQDRLDLLSRLPVPEPDTLRMESVIAAAGRQFAQGPAQPRARAAGGSQLGNWRSWFAPAATGLAALALVAVYLGPLGDLGSVNDPGALSDMAPADMEREKAVPPDAAGEAGAPPPPMLSRSAEEAAPAEGPVTSFGARPMPQGQAIEPESDLAATVERHVFDGVEIVSRTTPGAVTLALLRDGAETAFDTRTLDPGTDFALLDAFIQPGEHELLLMQSRIGTSTNWDAFTIEGDTITLSGRLSLLIHDAADRAGVAERLAADQAG